MVEDRAVPGVCEQAEVQVAAGSMGKIWREGRFALAMTRGNRWQDRSPVEVAMPCASVGEFERWLRPTLLSLL